ncbi:CobW family GTP-binding protein [Desulfosporosinus sp. SB140]|uniref:CobW family GTP-binding protein n=1 Tax=Desulfosporosinus paludis TaxID=3115649 RepID=UPI00388D7116
MVKFDIVSGFLGAGKTTLIKKILKELNRNEKVILIENDFGDVSVDKEFLKIYGLEIYELANGCVCCKLRGDFLLTLRQILSREVDRIIFEPSGIFILSEIFDLFKDFEVFSRCYINSVTTVVDAQQFFKNINDHSQFFKSQILNASTLVLSKVQFLTNAEIDQIKEELQALNEKALIVTKDWSDLSPQELLKLIANNPLNTFFDDTHYLRHNFETWGIKTSKIIAYDQLESFLEKCKNNAYGNILRGKGIIKSVGKFLEFQYVDGQYSIAEASIVADGIVSFIGKNLQTQIFHEIFFQ